jgi:hypothetical protein
MSDPPRRRTAPQQLRILPLFALVSPPIVWVLFLLLMLWPVRTAFEQYLLEAYFLLGVLSPVFGLLTLAILAVQYSLCEETEAWRMGRRKVAVLAGLAIIAPLWLFVIYYSFAVFHR